MENEFKPIFYGKSTPEEYEKLTSCVSYVLLQQVKQTADAHLETAAIDTLNVSGDNGSVRFRLKEYPGWQFGIWVIDKESNEDIIIHIFGTPVDVLGSVVGSMFTPWSASFCSSMSIERDEFSASLCNLCAVNRFVDYLKVIKNSGIFRDWIFNKKSVITWDNWDIAHDHGIFWYSIKNFFKNIFKCKKKKAQTSKKLLLD